MNFHKVHVSSVYTGVCTNVVGLFFLGALLVSLVASPIVFITSLLHLPKFYALLIGNLFRTWHSLTHCNFIFLYSKSIVLSNLSFFLHSHTKCSNLSNMVSIFNILCFVANLVLLIICFFIVHISIFFYHQLLPNLFFLHIPYGSCGWYAVRMALGCIVLYTLRFFRHQVCTFDSFFLLLISLLIINKEDLYWVNKCNFSTNQCSAKFLISYLSI
jgi:hypothetical protein